MTMSREVPDTKAARVKVSMNMLEDDFAALKAWAEQEGVSMTEIIRRSLVNERYLEEAQSRGAKVVIRHAGSEPDEILILPSRRLGSPAARLPEPAPATATAPTPVGSAPSHR
jgi:hypothetical protein